MDIAFFCVRERTSFTSGGVEGLNSFADDADAVWRRGKIQMLMQYLNEFICHK